MITNIILHKIGNKIHREDISLSTEELTLTEEMKELLTHFFLSAMKNQEETYHFYHESLNLNYNAVYEMVSNIFEGHSFIHSSEMIGKHLYEIVENPRIQGGELFVVKFQSEEIESVGIFKMERKDTFLKLQAGENSAVETDTGVGIHKIDKAAIILNAEKEKGYIVQVVDNNKNGDLYYWFEDFLKVKQRTDDYFHTQQTLQIFKDFVKHQIPQEFEISKADQADLLNKSMAFFKEKEMFEFEEFANEVLEDEGLIESFTTYKTDHEQETQQSISEEFAIHPTAVKKQGRSFKSIIRLDKNFHIYIHGNRKLIEQSEDKKGKFYKLYYENED